MVSLHVVTRFVSGCRSNQQIVGLHDELDALCTFSLIVGGAMGDDKRQMYRRSVTDRMHRRRNMQTSCGDSHAEADKLELPRKNEVVK
jgi:hypothetical protein